MLVGELDEDVFEAGSERTNLSDGNPVFQELVAEIVEIEMVFDKRVDGLTENGGAADAGEVAREAQRTRGFRSRDFNAQRAGRLVGRKLAKRMGCAVGEELGVINVGDGPSPLSCIH